jgi:hypothetical protein
VAEIYVTDPERRHGFDQAIAEYHRLIVVYPSLGYEVILLPKVSVAARRFRCGNAGGLAEQRLRLTTRTGETSGPSAGDIARAMDAVTSALGRCGSGSYAETAELTR